MHWGTPIRHGYPCEIRVLNLKKCNPGLVWDLGVESGAVQTFNGALKLSTLLYDFVTALARDERQDTDS